MDEFIKLLDKSLEYIDHYILEDTIYIKVTSIRRNTLCPDCGTSTEKVHSYYERRFQDLPIQGKKVMIILNNRKMFCNNEDCDHKTFAETFDFLPFKSKKTIRLEDDGTVMVDIDTHRIIDMIESREYNEVVTWLKKFPNLEIVSRDGSITYSNSIKDAHPKAIQVSDRFHLLKNLTTYCKKFLTKHLKTKVQIKSTIKNKDDNSLATKESQSLTLFEKIKEATKLSENGITNTKIYKLLKMDIRTLKIYLAMSFEEQEKHFKIVSSQSTHDENVSKKEQLISEVQKMHKKGSSNRAISKELKISRVTVANHLDKSVSAINGNYGITQSNTLLSPYHETINRLLLEGYTFKKIEDSIREQGYTGSPSTIRMYTTRMRKLNKEAIIIGDYKNVEFIERSLLIKLLYKPLEKVKRLSQEKLNNVLIEYPLVDGIFQAVLEFRNLFKSHEASNLDAWIETAKQLNIREINRDINGINRDIDAVKNSTTYTYSNGLAEGSVNKIKVIKRIMYGQCNFSTLRQKVLLLEKHH